MKRASIIATVAATGGILIAGSVAGVAVINAAASNAGEATSVTLVGATASPSASPSPSTTPPTATMSPLPELPTIEPADETPAATQGSPSSDRSTSSSGPESSASESSASESSASESSSTGISAREAARKAVAKSGGTVVSVSSDRRGGFAAWAVRIQRADGSIITGYVDKATGTVFDWVTNRDASPSPQPSASSSHDDDDDDDDHGSDDDSDDDHDSEDDDDSGDDHDSDDD
ncbi:MAG: hypothetical protein Q8M17_04525 [Actinomycetota bacterium]|nr:hypothetical protein [Actinomycetota bacterium]